MELSRIKIKNKKGAMGESIITIYRLVLVTIIGFFVLGVTAVAYGYYLDVKDREAVVLGVKIYDCIVDEGVIDISILGGYPLFKECFGKDSKDVFVRLGFFDIYDEDNGLISPVEKEVFVYGDSGLEWIKSLYSNKGEIDVKNIQKYKVGAYTNEHYTNFFDSNKIKLGLVKIEVFTRYDE